MYKYNSRKLAIYSIAFGVVFAFTSLLLFLFKTTEINFRNPINSTIFAEYGTLVGGVVGTLFSLAGIFLLIQNINDQETNFLKQQIENRFFELLKIHRENSKDITIKNRSGKKVFLSLLRELNDCLYVISILRQKHPMTEAQMLNLSYLAFFYGAVGKTSEEILKKSVLHSFSEDFVGDFFASFQSRQKNNTQQKTFNYKTFEGHQSRLGHYFRNLFQVIKYINEQPTTLLTYQEKYQYIKSLRAQLSTQEQALLFYNSISDLGKSWELGIAEANINERLITKYNLIKNIPGGYLNSVDPKKYYPDIFFEGDPDKTDNRKLLEKEYC